MTHLFVLTVSGQIAFDVDEHGNEALKTMELDVIVIVPFIYHTPERWNIVAEGILCFEANISTYRIGHNC